MTKLVSFLMRCSSSKESPISTSHCSRYHSATSPQVKYLDSSPSLSSCSVSLERKYVEMAFEIAPYCSKDICVFCFLDFLLFLGFCCWTGGGPAEDSSASLSAESS